MEPIGSYEYGTRKRFRNVAYSASPASSCETLTDDLPWDGCFPLFEPAPSPTALQQEIQHLGLDGVQNSGWLAIAIVLVARLLNPIAPLQAPIPQYRFWLGQALLEVFRPWHRCPGSSRETVPDIATLLRTANEGLATLLSVVEGPAPAAAQRFLDNDDGVPRGMAVVATDPSDATNTVVALRMHTGGGLVIVMPSCEYVETPSSELLPTLRRYTQEDCSWTWIRSHPDSPLDFTTTFGGPAWGLLPPPTATSPLSDRHRSVLQDFADGQFPGDNALEFHQQGLGQDAEFCITSPRYKCMLVLSIFGWEMRTNDNRLIEGGNYTREDLVRELYQADGMAHRRNLCNLSDAITQWVARKLYGKDAPRRSSELARPRFFPKTQTLQYSLPGCKCVSFDLGQGGKTFKARWVSEARSSVIKIKEISARLRAYRSTHVQKHRPYFRDEDLREQWSRITKQISIYHQPVGMRPITIDRLTHRQTAHLLKADMGARKTTEIVEIISDLRLRHPGLRVLVLTHRRALAMALSKKFGTACYLQEEGDHLTIDVDTSQDMMCISPDSVHRLPIDQCASFDVVILDEVEGFMGHLGGQSFSQPLRAFSLIDYWLKRSKLMLVADANMSPSTGGLFVARVCLQGSIHVHINTWRRPRNMIAYRASTKNHYYAHIEHVLKKNKQARANNTPLTRCVFASSIRVEIDVVRELIAKYDPAASAICFTAEKNVIGEKERVFLKDPITEAPRYDYLLYSPVISSGLSIDVAHFDRMFYFASPHSCAIDEQDQMLWRVRQYMQDNASLIYYIDNSCYGGHSLSSNEKEVYQNLTKSAEMTTKMAHAVEMETTLSSVLHFVPQSRQLAQEYLVMHSRLEARRADEKKSFRKQFECRLLDRGLDLHWLEAHPEESQIDFTPENISALKKKTQEVRREACVKRMLDASLLTAEQAETLRSAARHRQLTLEEDNALEKHTLMADYALDPDCPNFEAIVRADDQGKRREKFLLFAQLGHWSPEVLALCDARTINNPGNTIVNHSTLLQKHHLFSAICNVYGCADGDRLLGHKFTLTKSNPTIFNNLLILQKFLKATSLDTSFLPDWPTTNDVRSTSSFFRKCLEKMGLALKHDKGQRITDPDGRRSRQYLDEVCAPSDVDIEAYAERLLRRLPSFSQQQSPCELEKFQVKSVFVDGQPLDLAQLSSTVEGDPDLAWLRTTSPLEILWVRPSPHNPKLWNAGGRLASEKAFVLTLYGQTTRSFSDDRCYKASLATATRILTFGEDFGGPPAHASVLQLDITFLNDIVVTARFQTYICSEGTLTPCSPPLACSYQAPIPEAAILGALCLAIQQIDPDIITLESADHRRRFLDRLEATNSVFRAGVSRLSLPLTGSGLHEKMPLGSGRKWMLHF